ncbi:shikimate kinase [Pseudalkalibacillus berkeleyi]|uniref:Shikimate kinase n=1 Tax=Pseudalkalibacillus berkeleyi TaxID=1069813 RepID=A0ABS9GYP1_9BACL|nr:shikimate kinase [Pseudalkalibacillus berkeleyi]MCF6137882.1 shikimate kinase [Pseudalkalibacillus berkeleyi]
MKAIYLTGFMGVGKTTVGKALADNLNLNVIDLDDYIEEKLSADIPSIFQKKGEAYFRDQEQLALQELPTSDLVITTGGGVVLREVNRSHMKANGIVIHLEATVDTIFDRLSEGGRPLANGKSKREIAQMVDERKPMYLDAHASIETDKKSIEEIVEEISTWIKSVEIA